MGTKRQRFISIARRKNEKAYPKKTEKMRYVINYSPICLSRLRGLLYF